MTAGLDAADVECREGYSLVMKASNGVAMCLYSDTALKMIDRGIANYLIIQSYELRIYKLIKKSLESKN